MKFFRLFGPEQFGDAVLMGCYDGIALRVDKTIHLFSFTSSICRRSWHSTSFISPLRRAKSNSRLNQQSFDTISLPAHHFSVDLNKFMHEAKIYQRDNMPQIYSVSKILTSQKIPPKAIPKLDTALCAA